ncbi:YiiX/YebB-like N1pC/P60 family cysteine hydrolase [soil metagenome]
MKKAWPILVIILLLVGSYLLKPTSKTHKKDASYALTGDEKRLLFTGDIIMRRGDGMVSDKIATMLQEPFDVTHCGLILYEKDKLWVVHTLQDKQRDLDGIFAQDLDQFVSESRPGSIIVVRYVTPEDKSAQLIERMHYYMKQNIPFDLGFDAADPSKFYCNELLQHIYQETYGVDIFPIKLKLPTTDLLKYTYLFDTAAFQPIINHHLQLPQRRTSTL